MKNYNAYSFAGIIEPLPKGPIPPEFPENPFQHWLWECQGSLKD